MSSLERSAGLARLKTFINKKEPVQVGPCWKMSTSAHGKDAAGAEGSFSGGHKHDLLLLDLQN